MMNQYFGYNNLTKAEEQVIRVVSIKDYKLFKLTINRNVKMDIDK